MKDDIKKFTIKENSIMLDAIKSIQLSDLRTIIVVGKDNKVVGVISEGDILRALIDGISPYSPIKNIINVSFKFLHTRDMHEAYKFFKLGIDVLPIMSNDFGLIDIITIFDFLDQLDFN
jgi:mannose-1-phosphate guanylyltransferase / mannose-6-phosphate isomerase